VKHLQALDMRQNSETHEEVMVFSLRRREQAARSPGQPEFRSAVARPFMVNWIPVRTAGSSSPAR